jgi:hypothetical protein
MVLLAPLIPAQEKEVKDLSFCGPLKEKHEVNTQRETEAIVAVPPGKALIYFICRRGPRQVKLAIDGKWRAVVEKNTYSRIEIDPGVQHLCMASSVGTTAGTMLYLTAEAGKSYFLEGGAQGGGFNPVVMKAPSLNEIGEADARKVLAKSKLATFSVKER